LSNLFSIQRRTATMSDVMNSSILALQSADASLQRLDLIRCLLEFVPHFVPEREQWSIGENAEPIRTIGRASEPISIFERDGERLLKVDHRMPSC
jgi:hypothetical protein